MRTIAASLLSLALCFTLSAQSNDPCDEHGSDDPDDYACVGEQFGHPYNVDDIGCAGNCDSRGGINSGEPQHWANVHLGTKCVALGQTPAWIIANEQSGEFVAGASIPANTAVIIALDGAPFSSPFHVLFPFQSTQCYCDCFFFVPFAAYETWTIDNALASTPWGQAPTKLYDPWDFQIPNNPGLLGLAIYSQAYLINVGGPGVTTSYYLSNAIVSTIVAGS